MSPKTPETSALVSLENICDLPIGQTMTITGPIIYPSVNPSRLTIKTSRRGNWVCWLGEKEAHPNHARFADNKADLLSDLEHFHASGYLPVDKVQWF